MGLLADVDVIGADVAQLFGGINWLRDGGFGRLPVVGAYFGAKRGDAAIAPTAATSALSSAAPRFVAVELPVAPKATAWAAAESMAASPIMEPSIHIELRRGLKLKARLHSSSSTT